MYNNLLMGLMPRQPKRNANKPEAKEYLARKKLSSNKNQGTAAKSDDVTNLKATTRHRKLYFMSNKRRTKGTTTKLH